MAVPLPENPFKTDSESYHAYARCASPEQGLGNAIHPGCLPVLVSARLLGFLLLHAPTIEGRDSLASKIARSTDDELLALGELYNNGIVRCFRSNKGGTPPRSRRADPMNLEGEDNEQLLKEKPRTHAHAKMKALRRDNYRCMLTGKIDYCAFEAGHVTDRGTSTTIGPTRAAHIFGNYTSDASEGVDQRGNLSPVELLLDRFGGINRHAELDGPDVHRLENVLTLDLDSQEWFGEMEIWLEKHPDDPENCYRLAAAHDFILNAYPEKVQFTTPDPEQYPLPDPRYLALHATCAKAAHLSGAGDYVEKVYRNLELHDVLPADGDSQDLLYYALMRRPDIIIQ